MSISSTNSVSGGWKNRKYAFERAVKDRLVEKSIAQKRKIRAFHIHFRHKAATCTQCDRGMDMHIARLQRENQRENAPICIPCITGIARRPLSTILNKDQKCK